MWAFPLALKRRGSQPYRYLLVAVDTHGNLMALILKFFDEQIDYADWVNLQNPDVYRVQIEERLGKVSKRFNFVEGLDAFGVPDALPQLPLSLTYRGSSVEVSALLDTGASVNVLPYNVGIQLGAVWEEQTISVTLAGNLASVEARGC